MVIFGNIKIKMKTDYNNINKPEFILASDTDSLMINIGKILKHTHPFLDFTNNEQCLPIVKTYQKEISQKLNNYQSILAKNLLNSNEHFFDLKPEFILKKHIGQEKEDMHFMQ